MIKGSIDEIRREAHRLIDIDLLSDKEGFSLETWSYLTVLHEYYIKEMGLDYYRYHGYKKR